MRIRFPPKPTWSMNTESIIPRERTSIYVSAGGVENPEEMYGQKVTLQYLPSYLVHQYFELVE